ncbi:hypothetical protein FA13DRAFT_773431 [Coprinellus micaceus]|uniref:Uncharacterized protein n=1 Tax=Coprinellus micaceus TaxID=71717 RepID=A0A4Y7T334_COPMI|nr:hypothetical protein FA13DRAFT_773431 [Coprinellus micaceus]
MSTAMWTRLRSRPQLAAAATLRHSASVSLPLPPAVFQLPRKAKEQSLLSRTKCKRVDARTKTGSATACVRTPSKRTPTTPRGRRSFRKAGLAGVVCRAPARQTQPCGGSSSQCTPFHAYSLTDVGCVGVGEVDNREPLALGGDYSRRTCLFQCGQGEVGCRASLVALCTPTREEEQKSWGEGGKWEMVVPCV